MTTIPSQENDNSSVEHIKNTIRSDIVHCLLPRMSREAFIITLPSNISREQLSSAITKTLEKSMPTSCIFILCINKITETNDTNGYNVIFLNIHKQLINKLYLAGIKIANFYVGYSENNKEYPLLSEPPHDDKIAKCNRENVAMPYKASIQLNKPD